MQMEISRRTEGIADARHGGNAWCPPLTGLPDVVIVHPYLLHETVRA